MSQQLRIRGQFCKKSKKERADRIRATSQLYRQPVKPISLDDNVSDSSGELTPPTISSSTVTSEVPAIIEQDPFQVDTPSTSRVPDCVDVTGRRIVEIDHLAKQLYCNDCGKHLNLNNIVNEKRYGFGSVLMIECECGSCNEVSTGKTHRTGKRGPAVFDVNTKAALGMI